VSVSGPVLAERLVPDHNRRFSVAAAEPDPGI
jgi:hypothetical protein